MADCRPTVPPQNWSQKIDLIRVLPIILEGSNDEEKSILKEYAEFWKIPFVLESSRGERNVVVTSDPNRVDRNASNPIVFSPSGIAGAKAIGRQFNLNVTIKETQIRMHTSSHSSASLKATIFEFSGPDLKTVLDDGRNAILFRIRGSDVFILSIDLISEYRNRVYDRMDEKANWKFRLVTRMPFSYSLIPSGLRNRTFKSKEDLAAVDVEVYGPVECLRSVFLASLVVVSPEAIPIIRFWRHGKSYALAISHDVETRLGLEDGAGRLIEIEKELGVRSTWNVPSDRYPLSSQLLIGLAKSGEIGGHDTRHDGKLLFTQGKSKLQRVSRCKERLERLSGKEIRGFRAPLLQHSRGLVSALSEAGYKYDSSMPSWELLSPTSLKQHGVGTVFPIMISDIVEVPVSLPQDHQLIRAGGLEVGKAVDYLLKVSSWIKSHGGACVLLVHPDYELSQGAGLDEYRRLLESFRSDISCDIMTLGELARWWAHRHRSRITEFGRIETNPDDASIEENDDLEVGLVTKYGQNGFMIQSPNVISIAEPSDNSKQGQ